MSGTGVNNLRIALILPFDWRKLPKMYRKPICGALEGNPGNGYMAFVGSL